MTRKPCWSREEDKILLENYPAKSIMDLKASLPNRTYCAIRHRVRFLQEQGLLGKKRQRPKVDGEKFVELWNDGASVDEIAEFFGVSKSHVHFLRRRFGLEGRPSPKRREAAFKILSVLKEQGGYCELAHLTQHVSKHSINKLVEEGVVYKVSFEGRRGGGRKRRVKFYQIVRPEFARKTYICSNRTAIVRLLSHALMKPENSGVVRATTFFLKSLGLTAAETEAVLQMLKRKPI
jgi:hypothetical protein